MARKRRNISRVRVKKKPDPEAVRAKTESGKDVHSLDPFQVLGPKPLGKIYQWCAVSVLGQENIVGVRTLKVWKAEGWRPVPAKRHPRMRTDVRGQIVFGGQILCERSEKLSRAVRDKEIASARAMFSEHPGSGDATHPRLPGCSHFPEISPLSGEPDGGEKYEAAVDAQLKTLGEAKYVEIVVTFGLTLTAGEIDAARYLHLEPAEYARRKFLMRADVMQKVHPLNGGGTPIFNFVRLTTKDEWS